MRGKMKDIRTKLQESRLETGLAFAIFLLLSSGPQGRRRQLLYSNSTQH